MSFNVLTLLSLVGKDFMTTAMGHWFLLTWVSWKSTMSPSLMLGWLFCHLEHLWSLKRCSGLHLSQKCWTLLNCWRCTSASMKHLGGGRGLHTLWIMIMFGVRRGEAFACIEMVVRGPALIMLDTSSIRVDRTLWVRWDGWIWDSMESGILLETPIILSHTPV